MYCIPHYSHILLCMYTCLVKKFTLEIGEHIRLRNLLRKDGNEITGVQLVYINFKF